MTGAGRGDERAERAGRDLLGALLAGGGSRRYGSPKWKARVGDASMAHRAVRTLAPHTRRIVVLGSPEAADRLGLPVLADRRPGQGPLAGLESALAEAASAGLAGVFLLACDLPLVGPGVVKRIVAGRKGATAVVPVSAAGPEPLCAFYGPGAGAAVRSFLDAGGRSARAFVDRLDGARLLDASSWRTADGTPLFLNVNTPEERERAERALVSGAAELPEGG